MATKPSKIRTFMAALKMAAATDQAELLLKLDAKAAEAKTEIADIPYVMGMLGVVSGRAMQHQADTLRIIGEGLQNISTNLKATEVVFSDEGPEINEPAKMFVKETPADTARSYYLQYGYLDDPVEYYGPGSKDDVLLAVDATRHSNADMVSVLPKAYKITGSLMDAHSIPLDALNELAKRGNKPTRVSK